MSIKLSRWFRPVDRTVRYTGLEITRENWDDNIYEAVVATCVIFTFCDKCGFSTYSMPRTALVTETIKRKKVRFHR